MKVKDLLEKLSKLDPNLEIYCYEDGPVPIEGPNPGPFDIVDASSVKVVMNRVSGKPVISFGGDEATHGIAIIGITPDF